MALPKARHQLYSLFFDVTTNERKNLRAIESFESIVGFDLLLIFVLIVDNQLSGELNVVDSFNNISGITFKDGHIVRVDLPERSSSFGHLAIKQGFISKAQLSEYATNPKITLIDYLFKNKLATAEQLKGLLLKQMSIKLSRYVSIQIYSVSFVKSDTDNVGFALERNHFMTLLYDWVVGCFQVDWLKELYSEWRQCDLKLNLAAIKHLNLKEMPMMDFAVDIILNSDETHFTKILTRMRGDTIGPFLKGLHTLLIYKAVNFTKSAAPADVSTDILAKSLAIEPPPETEKVQRQYEMSITTTGFKFGERDKLINALLNLDLTAAANFLAMYKAGKVLQKSELDLFAIWYLIINHFQQNTELDLQLTWLSLDQLSPETKQNAEFYYVKALLYLACKKRLDFELAFTKCVKINGFYLNKKPKNLLKSG